MLRGCSANRIVAPRSTRIPLPALAIATNLAARWPPVPTFTLRRGNKLGDQIAEPGGVQRPEGRMEGRKTFVDAARVVVDVFIARDGPDYEHAGGAGAVLRHGLKPTSFGRAWQLPGAGTVAPQKSAAVPAGQGIPDYRLCQRRTDGPLTPVPWAAWRGAAVSPAASRSRASRTASCSFCSIRFLGTASVQ